MVSVQVMKVKYELSGGEGAGEGKSVKINRNTKEAQSGSSESRLTARFSTWQSCGGLGAGACALSMAMCGEMSDCRNNDKQTKKKKKEKKKSV